MQNIKMIVSDLDGTMLDNSYNLPEKNKIAVQKARAKGIKVVLATGRMHLSAKKYADELDLTMPIISYNGALIKTREGKVIYEAQLEENIAKEVLEYAFQQQIYVQSYQNDKFFYEKPTQESAFYERASTLEGKAVGKDGLLKLASFTPKLLFVSPSIEKTEEIAINVKKHFGNKIRVMCSSPIFIEILPPNIDKGYALSYLLEKEKINPSEIIVLGDSENDLPMFSIGAYGIAMENAIEELKKKATAITTKNEEAGVAEAIEKYVLKT